jgi:hypothetical protein
LLPVCIWTLRDWRRRKTFLIALGATTAALLLLAEWFVPGWLAGWITTLQAYTQYAGSRPLLSDLLPRHFVLPAAAVLLSGVVFVSLTLCEPDVLFAVSFSVAVFQLLLPFEIYNLAMLLPAALWILTRANRLPARGQLQIIAAACSSILLAAAWTAAAALSLASLLSGKPCLTLWQAPLAAVWLYPWAVFAALASAAVAAFLGRRKLPA